MFSTLTHYNSSHGQRLRNTKPPAVGFIRLKMNLC